MARYVPLRLGRPSLHSWHLLALSVLAVQHPLPLDIIGLEGPWDAQAITERGFEALQTGQPHLASRLFTAGIARHGHDGSIFNNLAAAMATLGMEEGDGSLICEAIAAAQIAAALGYAGARELWQGIESSTSTDHCKEQLPVKRDTLEQLLGGKLPLAEHIQLANTLCKEPGAVTLRPTVRERDLEMWTAAQLLRAWVLMRVCGVVSLEGILKEDTLARVLQAQHDGHLSQNQKGRFELPEAASRGSLRQEVQLPLQPPFTNPELCASPLLRSVMKMLLDERIEIDTFSYIESFPGSQDQRWHNDVPTPAGQNCHMAPVGMVAVVPLVHVNASNGATEFLTGSHVDVESGRFWMTEEGSDVNNATPHFQIPASVGTVLVFDLRLLHRGRANLADKSRPVLYMSYVREWFRDGVNFKDKQSRGWDALPLASRRLFSRLDSRAYVTQLEEALRALGGNIDHLASDGDYTRRQLEL